MISSLIVVKKLRANLKTVIIIGLLLFVFFISISAYYKYNYEPKFTVDQLALSQFKIFSGEEFNSLYESINYTKTLEIDDDLSITGNLKVDEYITKMAEKRGWRKRTKADESKLVNYNGLNMQPEMQAASKDNINIAVLYAYRSVELQRQLFTSRFIDASKKEMGRLYTPEEVLAGKADKAIDLVQQISAIPGYSRHHNGYTIDITELKNNVLLGNFKNTAAYRWISANNFLNAKKFGIIPSYPEGQTLVGPNPEEWEFVWVGVDKLKIQS